MSSVGAWDWMRSLVIGCPYKCGMTASAFDIDHHVIKCRQLWMHNGGRDLKICPYNRQHHVPVPEYQYHLERCGGGSMGVQSAVKSAEGTKSKLNVNAPVFTPRSSSNGSSCSPGGTTNGAALLPLTEHVPKSDPQYLPRGTATRDIGGYSAVDQWLNAQCARQSTAEPPPTSVCVNSSNDEFGKRQNYQNYELFELFPKQRRPLVASLEDLIDLECSHPEDQQQAMLGFQSVSSSSSGSVSQPQSERASPKSPDSDTPRPLQLSNLNQMAANPFVGLNGPAKHQLPGGQSLAETLEAWNKQQSMNNGARQDYGGQFEIRTSAVSGAPWSSWSTGVGEHLMSKGWTGF